MSGFVSDLVLDKKLHGRNIKYKLAAGDHFENIFLTFLHFFVLTDFLK
jgi:hypothetical protein